MAEPLADLINEGLAALLGCACEAVDPVCACTIVVGEFVDDFLPSEDSDCGDDDCSRLWVRVTDAYPANGIGIPSEVQNAECAGMLNLQIEVGIVRCVEIPDDGEAPTVDALLASSIQAVNDMVALRTAILCCDHFEDSMLGSWTPIGPVPGVGGFWELAVLV